MSGATFSVPKIMCHVVPMFHQYYVMNVEEIPTIKMKILLPTVLYISH